MAVSNLQLTDFRCFKGVSVDPDPEGLTVFKGPNGTGKTSLLEAIAWLATQKSFRSSSREAMIRDGADRAIAMAHIVSRTTTSTLGGEIPTSGSSRTRLNGRTARNRADVAGVLRVSVFSPDDLRLVQGGPVDRRDFLDEVLINQMPRMESLVAEVDRVLRQRASLLRQAGWHKVADLDSTLDVWDARLASAGEALVEAREALAQHMVPLVSETYSRLSGAPNVVGLRYRRSWDGELASVLASRREDDLRRQSTGAGPHRDEVEVLLDGRPARTHASQGEQRCMAMALRLAAHSVASAAGEEPPVLLLDDVLSELDYSRAHALMHSLPPGQVMLTSAVDPPKDLPEATVVDVTGIDLGRSRGLL